MKPFGIGTDIVECARIQGMIDRHGDVFLERVFTPLEREYCAKYKQPVERYAARWAGKEAIMKALGTGWSKGIAWTDLEIANEVTGKPTVRLSGPAREYAKSARIAKIDISLSHCQAYAVAYALAIECADHEEPLVSVGEVSQQNSPPN